MEGVLIFLIIGAAGVTIATIVTKGLANVIAANAHPHDREGLGETVRALEERVDQLQQQLAEMAERQDFAERMLAQARERGLPPGGPPPGR